MLNDNVENNFELDNIIKELIIDLKKCDNGWQTLSDDMKPFKVDIKGKFIFEIRPKEAPHNIPHFHVITKDNNGSYSIVPVSKIKGNFKDRDSMQIIKWGNRNQDKLIEKWNYFHENKKIYVLEGEL